MIKKKRIYKKRKRNPKHIDDEFIELLAHTLLYPGRSSFSELLSYYNIGEKCDDCGASYVYCTCEGSREKIEESCEDCKQNRCICDQNIWEDREIGIINYEKIQKEAWKFVKYLNKNQLIKLKKYIIQIYDTNNIEDTLFLKKKLEELNIKNI